MSAALTSRDAGECHAIEGDPIAFIEYLMFLSIVRSLPLDLSIPSGLASINKSSFIIFVSSIAWIDAFLEPILHRT